MLLFFKKIQATIIAAVLILFPLFFLTTTQEFFQINKFYFLGLSCLLLLIISTVKLAVSKQLTFDYQDLDKVIVIFLITVALSIILTSPNKIQALLNPNFGLVTLVFLTVFYFYLSRQKTFSLSSVFYLLSSLIPSLLAIFFFFNPLKNVAISPSLQFLKKSDFTPLGNQLDLAIFLGFFVVLNLIQIINLKPNFNKITSRSIFNFSCLPAGTAFLIFNLIAFSLTLYSLIKPATSNQQLATPLLSYRLSWYAAVETLKNPLTALFGVGVDNFSSMFTRVRDLTYNQSPLWQINSFNLSRSLLLHIFTESGLFGLLAFSLLLFISIKKILHVWRYKLHATLVISYWLLVISFFPPSLIVWFLFFITLGLINNKIVAKTSVLSDLGGAHPDEHRESTPIRAKNMMSSYISKQQLITQIDLSNNGLFLISLVFLSLVFIASSGYLLARSYAAEYYFKKSLDGFGKNNLKIIYDNMRQAIIFNPYVEKFRVNFSQVNLLVANNISSKLNRTNPPSQLTAQDKQILAQAIQAAIAEAKAATSLNPQKAGYWENLALVYRSILNTVQGADSWAISSYQRAIVADPKNPSYRLSLGGAYYSIGRYDEAVNFFSQAVVLKPDWANAHYNLAWAYYQKKDYVKAVVAMQTVLKFISPIKDKTDYERAQKELEGFKKQLPKTSTPTTPSQPGQLNLPQPVNQGVEPKLQLPSQSSPAAK